MARVIYNKEQNKVIIDQKEYAKADFEELYINKNLTYKEMSETIGKNICVIQAILRFFSIKKDTSLVSKNRQNSLIDKYGVPNVSQIQEVKTKKEESSLKKYGVSNVSKAKEVQLKKEKTFQEHYGQKSYFQTQEFKDYNKEFWLKNYGVDSPMRVQENKDKICETNINKYGVPWSCMRPEARNFSSNDSQPNIDFAKLLDDNNILYQREFCLDNKSFDFKVGDILIEINPTATHNIEWSPFGSEHKSNITSNYHNEKSKIANENGHRCIHVWDWDNKDSIITLLTSREKIPARKCEVKEVSKEDAILFIAQNHIQGYAESKINIGLYYKDDLVSIMTFGKPRYNNKYQYELIRYCSKYNVTGGAEKLFKHFMMAYTPQSVISYCDLSKFDGSTYIKLGFTKLRTSAPSLHWYNIKTHQHYNDSLIRAKGFSRIVHHCEPSEDNVSGKNYDLMISEGFLPVYDCGQAVFDWHNS